MALWMEESLRGINKHLRQLEKEKLIERKREMERIRHEKMRTKALETEFNDWVITDREIQLLDEMSLKLRGYVAKHATQERVLSFLESDYRTKPYMILYPQAEPKDLSTYVDKSLYWIKKTATLTTKGDIKIDWVFAHNKDMGCVICLFENNYIITTESSHENILNHIEGKPTHTVEWFNERDGEEELDPIEELLNSI